MKVNQIIQGDTFTELKKLPSESINTIITSPPYWALRDYGVEDQIGLEPILDEYIDRLLSVTKELKRVLRKDGVMFWNHGDCYGGNLSAPNQPKLGKRDPYKDFPRVRARNRVPKCLSLQNYRLILKMIDEQSWILRNTIIWHKPNHMPSSVKDRFANSYEPVYMLVKNKKYWFDLDAVRKPHQYPEDVARRIKQDKEDGIMPFAKDNKDGVAWRRDQLYGKNRLGGFVRARELDYQTKEKKWKPFNIRDRVEKGGKPVAFMASPQETSKYAKGSEFEKNYGEPWDRFGKNTKKSQKYVTSEQSKETQNETGWIEGSGRVRSFYDNYGGETNPKGKNPGDVWKIPTQPFPEAHFAVFPEKLVEPMILSSCPKEVCKKCGKARERILKHLNEFKGERPQKSNKGGTTHGLNKTTLGQTANYQTLGWTDCKCGAGFESGIVFDPFMGAGTVAVVAKRFGRDYLGIELNKEYIKIAEQRIKAQPQPLL